MFYYQVNHYLGTSVDYDLMLFTTIKATFRAPEDDSTETVEYVYDLLNTEQFKCENIDFFVSNFEHF